MSTKHTQILKRFEADYSLLMTEYQVALKTIESLQACQKALEEKNSNLQAEIARLQEQIRLMQHRRFGKSSEVQVGEAIIEINQEGLETVASYTRKKGQKTQGRLVDMDLFPRHRIYHDLPETQKTCKTCSHTLIKVGEETSEQLEVLPMRFYVAEHIRYKYACRCCQTIEMAPKPKSPIPKSLAGGSLLTEVIVNKYHHHLPLYRQSKIFESYHARIPDNTLGNWVIQSGHGLMPVYQSLWKAILGAAYLQVDESPVKILKPEKNGYLWTYFAPHIAKGLVVFELSLTRSGMVAEERLAGFKGLLQTDGYAGYNNLRVRKDITGFGCLSHARRKFHEVFKITNNSTGIAAEFLERLKPLYALEARMREKNLSFHTRKRLRQKQAWPILKALLTWLKQQLRQTSPKSKLAQAMQYTLNQWPYLIAYVRHGTAEIDTNWVENQIRPTALGKKNWLFMGHEDSGTIHALWYSLVLSALLNGLNPRVYVHYLLSKIHDIRTKAIEPTSLLPHTIDHECLRTFAVEQIALVKAVLEDSS